MDRTEQNRTEQEKQTFAYYDNNALEFKKFRGEGVALSALLHLEKDELTSTLITLRKQLRQGGIGLITLKKGTGTEVDSKGRFYSYYLPEELAKYLLAAGFEVVEQSILESKGQTHICNFVKNP